MTASAIEESYTKICKIGSGSYGTVYLYERKKSVRPSFLQELFRGERQFESDYVAVKLYKKPNNNREGIDFSCLREINCLQGLTHKNIVNCYEIIYQQRPEGTGQFHEVYVVMDYHLEISDLLKAHNSIDDKKRIAKQITKGLHYLHENYIFHRVNLKRCRI
jgi:serine/threonine protein kinase